MSKSKILAYWPDVANKMAWLMATDGEPQNRSGTQARVWATKACELTGYRNPYYLHTLAAAHGELGQFNEALEVADRALILAQSAGYEELEGQLMKAKSHYRKEEPLRRFFKLKVPAF